VNSRRTVIDPDAALAIIDKVRDDSARVLEDCRSRIHQRLAELPPNASSNEEFRIRLAETDRARVELDRIHDDSLVAIRAVMFPLQ
jgi:hypothetical protein